MKARRASEVSRVAGLMRVVDEKGAAYFDHARPLFREVEREHEPGADVRGPQAR